MGIDLSRFKVIYGEKVLNAVSLQNVDIGDLEYPFKKSIVKPKFLEVLALNEDGNIIMIHDEAWCFQFLPIVTNKNQYGRPPGKGTNMEDLIKNIKEMGLDWFLACLEPWLAETDVGNVDEVMENLNEYLVEERSYADN